MADPIAVRSGRAFWAFGWYLRWFFYRRFHAVRLSRSGSPQAYEGRPLIIYGNHPSWWDPALYILLCVKLFPGRLGYGPMDAKALGTYGVFERMGVFGIALDSPRGAARFLSTSLRILSDPASVLWITAARARRHHPAARGRIHLLEREPARGPGPIRRPHRNRDAP
jgi:hypothetical protein